MVAEQHGDKGGQEDSGDCAGDEGDGPADGGRAGQPEAVHDDMRRPGQQGQLHHQVPPEPACTVT